MVGKSSARTLELLGIKTIGDLAHTDPAILTSHLKSHGQTIWEYANGLEYTPIDAKRHTSKGIGNSTTLSSDVTERAAALKVLLSLSESVSSRLRRAGQLAGMVSVEIKFHNFHTVSPSDPSPDTEPEYRYDLQLCLPSFRRALGRNADTSSGYPHFQTVRPGYGADEPF